MKTGIHISYMINNVVSLGRKKNKKNDQAILKPQKFCFDNKVAWFTIISLKIRTLHVNIREGVRNEYLYIVRSIKLEAPGNNATPVTAFTICFR